MYKTEDTLDLKKERPVILFCFIICLRHCATSRKVEGSIPDNVIGIFHGHNPSGRAVTLGLTQPLTEMGTRKIFCGVKAVGA